MRILSILLLSTLWSCGRGKESAALEPAVHTGQVTDDPDDPAVWMHPADPGRSLVLGTNKVAGASGALVVFGLDGKIRQTIAGIDRPNNVDVEYGLMLEGKPVDIAVLTERRKQRLRVFRIPPDGGLLEDIGSGGGIQVFEGQQGDMAAPMGIALYKRPADGAVFAIVSRKIGPSGAYLWQYRLEGDGAGKVRGSKVREFGAYSGGADNEIEAVAVDDSLGYVYYADEAYGIRKYFADPDHAEAARELAVFATAGFKAQREGIAVYARPDGTGYIVCTDQLPGASEFHVFSREGTPGKPHDHREAGVFRAAADSTDGIEATAANLGPAFPDGLFIAMNSSGKNFVMFRWGDVEKGWKRR